MLEINVTVRCPDLVLAASALTKVFHAPETANPTPVVAAQPAPAVAVATPATATHTPAQNPAPVTAAPIASAAPVTAPAVPTAVPTYTIEQIAKAGAELAQSGKMPQLLALLQQYNIQAVTMLQPAQYGAFATALRGLGANL